MRYNKYDTNVNKYIRLYQKGGIEKIKVIHDTNHDFHKRIMTNILCSHNITDERAIYLHKNGLCDIKMLLYINSTTLFKYYLDNIDISKNISEISWIYRLFNKQFCDMLSKHLSKCDISIIIQCIKYENFGSYMFKHLINEI